MYYYSILYNLIKEVKYLKVLEVNNLTKKLKQNDSTKYFF